MKRAMIAVSILLLLGIAGYIYMTISDIVVTLNERDIQEKLNEAFPIEKTYADVVTAKFSHPVVVLEEGSDRLKFRMDAGASAFSNTVKASGSGQVSGKVRFDAATGKFYLDEPSVERISIDGVPSQYTSMIESGANMAIGPVLQNRPIYQLKGPLFQGYGVDLRVKNVVVQGGVLKITLGHVK
jgi:hypothetical protein